MLVYWFGLILNQLGGFSADLEVSTNPRWGTKRINGMTAMTLVHFAGLKKKIETYTKLSMSHCCSFNGLEVRHKNKKE